MSRQWQPGDVAIVNSERLFWTVDHGFVDKDGDRRPILSSINVARPLVVIDPEDREQVERLMDDYDRRVIAMHNDPDPRDVTPAQRHTAMQAALREFANPHVRELSPGVTA